MVKSLTVVSGSDRVYLTTADASYDIFQDSVWKSFVNDSNFADEIYRCDSSSEELEDTTCLQEWSYYYWIGRKDTTMVAADKPGRLFQPKVYGRKGGAHAKRSSDYNIECELCGFSYPRNTFRRGYVKPHVMGSNYLPNVAAPENWTWGPAPLYFDANNYLCYRIMQGTQIIDPLNPLFSFPQIEQPLEKASRYGGGHRYPGCPILNGNLVGDTVSVGTPTSSVASGGSVVLWYRPLPDQPAVQIQASQIPGGFGQVVWVDIEANASSLGWRKYIVEDCSWNSTDSIVVSMTTTAEPAYCVFGGIMITTQEDPEMACLPDRATGVGEYTVGGMMDLCPDCYSGLRRRVPWE